MQTGTKSKTPTEGTAHRRLAEALSRSLADTYTLYLKTQNFHWNVTGATFFGLHKALEDEYKDLATAVDDIAERIRTMSYPVNATFSGFQRIATVKEDSPTAAREMVESLIRGHEATIATLRAAFEAAEEVEDQGAEDLLGDRIRAHEKTLWMLKSVLA